MSKINLTKKISMKTVFGAVKEIRAKCEEGEGKAVPLIRVTGIANGMRSGETANGEFVALRGDFQGVNLYTGEVFRGVECFLPDVAQQMIINALYSLDDKKGQVKFGFDIVGKEDESAITGYVYEAIPLVAPAENDPLAELAENLPELPALPAPKKEVDEKAKAK